MYAYVYHCRPFNYHMARFWGWHLLGCFGRNMWQHFEGSRISRWGEILRKYSMHMLVANVTNQVRAWHVACSKINTNLELTYSLLATWLILRWIYTHNISFVELTAHKLIIWHWDKVLAIQISWCCAGDCTKISRQGLEPAKFAITIQRISIYESKIEHW